MIDQYESVELTVIYEKEKYRLTDGTDIRANLTGKEHGVAERESRDVALESSIKYFQSWRNISRKVR